MNEQLQDFARLTASAFQNASLSQRQLLHSFEALFEDEALAKAVLLEALEHKSDGVVFLWPEGEIAFLNETARAILQEADGLTFADGRFVTARRPETRRLQDFIRNASARAAKDGERPRVRTIVTRPSGKAPYVVCISPVQGSYTPQGRCFVHILDLAAHASLSKEVVCATFGLSEREGDLAVELARSNNLKSAAAHAGMAVNTARNHIQNIFVKCRVHSQMELSRILTKLV